MAGVVGPRAQLLTRRGSGRAAPTPAQSRPRATVAVLERIRLVAHTLEREPGLTSPEVAERVGFPRRFTSLLLLRLEEHRLVAHVGRRWFPGSETVS